jgi:hypothetical protein
MKEQVLVFFSDLYEDGQIIDYTQCGEVERDILEGGCFTTGDLNIQVPLTENYYGLWIWEGNIGFNKLIEDIEYEGEWRRLTPEEIVLLVKGLRVCDDLVQSQEVISNMN